MKRRRRRRISKIERILSLLKQNELTVPQIAKSIGSSTSYVYMLMYRLEAQGKVERYWEGGWVWKLKRKNEMEG